MHSSLQILISVKKLSKTFTNTSIFKQCSFTIHAGEKIGLVGPNGSGKTTLLKIISGELSYDEGTLNVVKNAKVAYLPQVHDLAGLSGGEAAKREIIPIMKSNADLYLLDEPTNNLDTDGLVMLENFISQNQKAFLIVSHDREFLDRTVTKIIEIDEQLKTTFVYEGNYSEYIEQKSLRIERQWKEYADKVEKSQKFETSIDEKVGWKNIIEQKRKNIRNLPIHEREKGVAAILRDKEGRMGKRARIIKDRLEKYKEQSEEIVKPAQPLPLHISFEETKRSGTKVLELIDVQKKYGKTIVGPFSLSVQYGERILIQGKNGAGKSTLLKMIVKEILPDNGTIEHGVGIRFGYIAQASLNNQSDITALEAFMARTGLEAEESRRNLNRFRITSIDVYKKVRELSPGEYSRLLIASIVAEKPNCIILDEPTNHLDLEVLEELEKALQAFNGTLIVVSHDRYFIKKLGITKILTI